ncbi:MAG: hypothetical protein Q8J74_13885 [Candidatus Didemnitutus sp.]|nr:hypothetical protein [Candidatus Didemnitutus sp.]
MNNLDQKIQAALRQQGASAELLDEPNLAEEVFTAFRGRNRVISTIMFVVNILIVVAAVWSAVKFYGAESTQLQLQWGALAMLLIMAASFLKVWFWLEMHTNRVLRELKRVELLLVTRRDGEK